MSSRKETGGRPVAWRRRLRGGISETMLEEDSAVIDQAAAPERDETRRLLIEWERRARLNLRSHNIAERHFDRLNTACSLVTIGSLVGLGTTATAFNLTQGSNRLFAISLSVVAALASSLQAISGYARLAEAHRMAARRHAALSRRVERTALKYDREDVRSDLDAIQREWDLVSESAPKCSNEFEAAG